MSYLCGVILSKNIRAVNYSSYVVWKRTVKHSCFFFFDMSFEQLNLNREFMIYLSSLYTNLIKFIIFFSR